MAEQKKFNLKAAMASLKELDVNDLNNIDWENMGSWPVAGKFVFCVLICVAVLAGGYFYLISSEIESLEIARLQEQSLKQEFENKAFRVANLNAYKEQLVEMEATFGSLLQQLPRDTEIPGLIDDISAAALSSGLQLDVMDPQRMTKTEFYNEMPINIEVTGSFHEMGAFVSAVSSLPRIVTLHDFSIDKMQTGLLKMKVQAKTYQYSAETLAAPGSRGAR